MPNFYIRDGLCLGPAVRKQPLPEGAELRYFRRQLQPGERVRLRDQRDPTWLPRGQVYMTRADYDAIHAAANGRGVEAWLAWAVADAAERRRCPEPVPSPTGDVVRYVRLLASETTVRWLAGVSDGLGVSQASVARGIARDALQRRHSAFCDG
jgi:hypothetical protein